MQVSTNKSPAVFDGATGGLEGFYFLPPMVKSPSYNGTFDANLSPVVEIFETTESEVLHASFTMDQDSGSEVVQMDGQEENYIVNWHTDQTGTVVGQTYRIRISVAGTVLGHADVQMAENGGEAKNLTDGQIIALVDGRTLPIKFRIEEGTVYTVGPEGGSLSTNEGLVNLVVPANATGQEIGIIIEPVQDNLNDPDVVPGALFDFGPSPYTFNEELVLTIKYDPANLPVGVSEDELRLLAVVNGEWVQLPGSSVDPENNTVTGPLNSFSRKGVGRGKVHDIEVSPVDPSIAIGETLQFEAVITNVDNEIMSRKIQWSGSDDAIATIDNTGLATAVSLGEVTIEAKSGKISGTAVLTVESPGPVVSRIEVTPATAVIEVGTTQQFTALAYDQSDVLIEGKTFVWSSSDSNIASVDETGQSIGIAQGEATISATLGSVVGTASLTVVAPVLSSPFVTKWDTNLAVGTRIALALDGTVDASIDWGDGTNQQVTEPGPHYHTYSQDGIYTVSVEGTVTAYFTYLRGGNDNDKLKLIEVSSWGDVGFTNMYSAFRGAINLKTVPSSGVGIENVTNMKWMFVRAESLNQETLDWNTGNVTDMEGMFSQALNFNGDISNWDTGKVTNMNAMFNSAKSFNRNIGNWNTGNVTDMGYMFSSANVFDQNIEGWDTHNVTNMSLMFSSAQSFNQDLANWDTGNVTNMFKMFMGAISFNGDIGGWNTANVTNMKEMFLNAISFNRPLGGWDTSKVTDMYGMFVSAKSFNQDLGGWNTGSVTDMSSMFYEATSFNGNVGTWDTGNVTDMAGMFGKALAFNQNIGNWNTVNVTYMDWMFYNASSFNQDLSRWCVPVFLSEPSNFDTGATSWVLPRPVWGTCPTN